MNPDDEKYRAIIAHYGEPAQVLKAIEECSELQIALFNSLLPEDEEHLKVLSEAQDYAYRIQRYMKRHIDYNKVSMGVVDKGLLSECADVENMLNQLEIMIGSWKDVKKMKLERTMERINNEKNKQLQAE